MNVLQSSVLNFVLPGDPKHKRLDDLRDQVAATKSEMEAVRRAYLAPEEAQQNLVAMIEHAPGSSGHAFLFAAVAERQYAGRPPDLNWGTLALLNGGAEKLADKIIECAFKKNGYVPGLPRAEREKKLQALRARLRDLETQEERETLALERAGNVILRREDADVTVILELWAELEDDDADATNDATAAA